MRLFGHGLHEKFGQGSDQENVPLFYPTLDDTRLKVGLDKIHYRKKLKPNTPRIKLWPPKMGNIGK